MVPGKEVRGCRVDFDNLGEAPRQAVMLPPACRNLVEWAARLHVGEGKRTMRQRAFSLAEAVWELAGHCLAGGEPARQRVHRLLDDAYRELGGNVPDATTLQAAWAGRTANVTGPDGVADTLAVLVDRHFPPENSPTCECPRAAASPSSRTVGCASE
jgi:hypothetical protein